MGTEVLKKGDHIPYEYKGYNEQESRRISDEGYTIKLGQGDILISKQLNLGGGGVIHMSPNSNGQARCAQLIFN